MTIINRTAREEYEMHEEHATEYALATNQAFDALREIAAEHGLKVPGDDRAENVVTAIFAMLYDFNNPYGAQLRKIG